MAISAAEASVFIPELWTPLVQKAREDKLVAGKRTFDVSGFGEIKKKGDIVHVPIVSNLSATQMNTVASAEVTAATVSELDVQLTITNWYAVRFPIGDAAEVQSAYDLTALYSQKIGHALAEQLDSDILGLWSGLSQTVGATSSDDFNISETNIVRAMRMLDSANAPAADRSIIIDSYGVEDLRLVDKFTRYDAIGKGGSDNPIVGGNVGSFYGVGVYQTENLDSTSVVGRTLSRGLVLHKEAFMWAAQMNQKMEMYRNTPLLRDEIFSQSLYGVQEYRDNHGVVLSYTQEA